MPVLPDANVFARTADIFSALRDGFEPQLAGKYPPPVLVPQSASVSINPSAASSAAVPVRKGYGCMVITPYSDPEKKIAIHRGWQGQVLAIKDTNDWARVFFPGLGMRVVPVNNLQGGTVPFGNWTISGDLYSLKGLVLTVGDITSALRTDGLLAKAIKSLLHTMLEEEFDWLPDDFYGYLSKNGAKVGEVTALLLQGVQNASLLSTLDKNDFTVNDIIQQGEGVLRKHNDSGVYVRLYLEEENSTRAYVGHSKNMGDRLYSYLHLTGSTSGRVHNALIRRVPKEKQLMIKLCILPQGIAKGYIYLAEQVFVCLLQSYPSWTFKANLAAIDEDEDEVPIENDEGDGTAKTTWARLGAIASQMQEVAKNAAVLSNWPGAIRRQEFGVKDGLNLNSPLWEWSLASSNNEFIRMDGFVEIEGKVVPVANFRRPKSFPCEYSYNRGDLIIQAWHVFNLQSTDRQTSFQLQMRPGKNKPNGQDWPLEGDHVYTTIQVRLDWKKHPQAWARLPNIGIFEDWHRANSFAFRYEWQDKDGAWHRRWLQAGYVTGAKNLSKLASPGQLLSYEKGSAIIHSLFGEPCPRHGISPFAGIVVKRAELDYLQQTIRLGPQSLPMTPTLPLSKNRVSRNDLIQAMRSIPGIQNVGVHIPTRGFSVGGPGQPRRTCDLCLVHNSSERCKVTDDDDTICTNCRHRGPPCCSWTPLIKDGPQNAAEVQAKAAMQHYLVQAPLLDHADVTFEQRFQEIEI